MTWHLNEIVRSGSATARVKSFNEQTGFLVLFDIVGEINPGDYIVGDDSGTAKTITNFDLNFEEYDKDEYADTRWNDFENFIHDDNFHPGSGAGLGDYIALEEHFTGKPSQDFQTTYLVRIDAS